MQSFFQCKWVRLSSWRYYSALNFFSHCCLKFFGFAKFITVLREVIAEATQGQSLVLPIMRAWLFFLCIAVEWWFIADNLLNSGHVPDSVRSLYSDKVKKGCAFMPCENTPLQVLFWVMPSKVETQSLTEYLTNGGVKLRRQKCWPLNLLFPQSSQSAAWLGAPSVG